MTPAEQAVIDAACAVYRSKQADAVEGLETIGNLMSAVELLIRGLPPGWHWVHRYDGHGLIEAENRRLRMRVGGKDAVEVAELVWLENKARTTGVL